ncbi:carbon-nitrogen family hydrolase [Falsibacillus albus]|uniref:Carbon-nitrogen family hydrolase n=1 Tax=Falsibacillus albus TaxID=2478915 RepID=A0A3L7K219_9BACI|nr:carbon-nitrogen family hydrolase [Falsibacillus albus]RLQ97108.1 carbon-nitrogen family hydrolase [Falsibacillus albus]
MKIKVACIQMDIAFGQPERNFENAFRWIEEAARSQCRLIVLPELWTTGYDLPRLNEIGDPNGEQLKGFLKKCAKKFNVDIIGGSTAQIKDSKFYNSLFAVDKNGQVVKEYSKLHLFKLMDEHHFLSSGRDHALFNLNGHTFASFICYDIRFPEWLRKHVLQGAEAIFVVAEWPLPRLNHWKTLLVARAIENQCYVVACNRSGDDPKNTFAGHSLIIDPWGEIIAEGSEGEGLIVGEIDMDLVKKVRKQIPVFDDRLSDFY